MNDFVFSCPTKVYFGKESAKEAINSNLTKYGKNVMLTYGGGSVKKNGIFDEIMSYLNGLGKNVTEFGGITPNPTYDKVQEGARLAKANNIDFILALGGGSVIDCSKIIAVQAVSEEDIWDMEFEKHKLPAKFIPMGAVVTVSGTGAEMNGGAVITNTANHIKTGMYGYPPCFSVLDPSYTLTAPLKQVISGAFDTLSHCMETYFGSPYESFISDEINEAVMRNVIKNIKVVVEMPNDLFARGELMWAASIAENGMLKIGKVTDFQAHMIEHQIGAYTNCNHGQGLAVIHPVLYRHIYKHAEAKFTRFAKEVWNRPTAEDGIKALSEFIKQIGLPTTFREMGLVSKGWFNAVASSSIITTGCCKKLDSNEILEILEECY